jgi:hypothetical protein
MFETTGYGAIETALVQSYNVPAKALGAFRARITAMQKDGLFGPENQPGKGRAVRYTPDLLHRLVFACECLEFGIAPATILTIVRERWDRRLRKIFKAAEVAAQDHDPGESYVILYLPAAQLMTAGFRGELPDVDSCRQGKLADHMTEWMLRSDDLPPRAMITNLSMRLRAFHAAFAVSFPNEKTTDLPRRTAIRTEPEPAPAARRPKRRRRT